MNISLKSIIKIGGAFEENMPYNFVKLFGAEMELSPENISKLLRRANCDEAGCFASLMEMIRDEEVKTIIKELDITFCERCWEVAREDIMIELYDKFSESTIEKKQEIIIKQFELILGKDKDNENNNIK